VSTMSVLGGRWAVVGNNRWTKLLASDAAHTSGLYHRSIRRHKRGKDDRAKASDEEARVKELRARSRAGKERLVQISEVRRFENGQGQLRWRMAAGESRYLNRRRK
jgi:hypothetical protein